MCRSLPVALFTSRSVYLSFCLPLVLFTSGAVYPGLKFKNIVIKLVSRMSPNSYYSTLQLSTRHSPLIGRVLDYCQSLCTVFNLLAGACSLHLCKVRVIRLVLPGLIPQALPLMQRLQLI